MAYEHNIFLILLPSMLSPGFCIYINSSLFKGLQDHQVCVNKANLKTPDWHGPVVSIL